MALFNWKLNGTGDWSDAANWNLLLGSGVAPPGSGDFAILADAGAGYTVHVSTTVDVGEIAFDSFQAINIAVDAGGLLNVTVALTSLARTETVTVSGTGAGGHLELNFFSVGPRVDFAFDNTSPASLNGGAIQFDNVPLGPDAVFRQPITDVARGNEFVVAGANFSDDTVTYDGFSLRVLDTGLPDPGSSLGDTLFLMEGVTLDPGFDASPGNDDFAIVNGNTIEAVCYARGTMIRTPDGELPVEKLRPGKQVITLVDGEEVPQTVAWLGHRRIGLAGHPRPETVAPIRIQRDAFADGMPHRDLLVSPDHAVFVDGLLICARQLVNGTTIRQELEWTAVDYYHVELDQHAILLAEGLPAESYIDTGNSGFFANSGAPLVLHPDLTDETDCPTREAGSCAPFVWDEASVQPAWQRLADRAAAIGQPASQRVTTTDADMRLLADQRTIKPIISDSDRVVFVLPRRAREVRLVSRAQSPTEARPWLEDRRRLGVRVKRIVLRGADETREVPVDHPDLTQGWWAVERDGQLMSRWTDGEAVLPLPAMSGTVMLEIHLAGSMTYVVDAAPAGGTARRAAA